MPLAGKKSKTGSAKKKKNSANEDHNQKTISSFFQTGSDNKPKPEKSGLFSEVGQKTNVSKLALKKPNLKLKYKETESVNPDKEADDDKDVIVIDEVKVHQESGHTDSSLNINEGQGHLSKNGTDFTVVKKGPKDDKCNNDKAGLSSQNDPIIIPETQVSLATKTPKVKGQDEEEMIPDTPQSDRKDEPVKKKLYGRSFLTAGANVTKNPYVMNKEKIDKKKLSKAKKGLIAVSVQFNPDKNNAVVEDIIDRPENSCSIINGEFKSPEPKEISGVCHRKVEESTPTKIYDGERTSIKRMSKCGESPDSKRFLDKVGDAKTSTLTETNEIQCGVSKNLTELMESDAKTERSDCESKFTDSKNSKFSPDSDPSKRKFVHEKTEHREKKPLKPSNVFQNDKHSSLSHQLSLTRKKRSQDKNVDLEKDSCLGAILTELNDKTPDDSSKVKDFGSEVKSFKPSVISLKKNRKSLSNVPISRKQSGLSKSFDDSLTEDDMKYLNDLDENVHVSVSKSVKTSKQKGQEEAKEADFQKPCFISKKKSLSKKMEESLKKKETLSNEIIPTQTIVEILSQLGKDNENVPDERDEIDITEFPTQAKQHDIGDEMDFMSSFEVEPDESESKPAIVQYGRHKVDKVDRNVNGHDILLHLTDSVSGGKKTCVLSGFWSDTHVFENDIVHIQGRFEDGTCRVSDAEGLIIINPDILLSGTTVVSSVFCMRKGVLNEKFKGVDGGNVQMLYGSIIHCVFQQVLQKQLTTEEEILQEAENTVKQSKFIHDMYKGNTTESEVLQEIKVYIPQIRKWLEQYTDFVKPGQQNVKKEDLKITKISDIEENIWSPRFGVKGKIDLTVEVQIKNQGRNQKSVVPLELKTGRTTFSMEHKGQVTLYSMMSSDRRPDPGQGLLLYLKEAVMKMVPANHLNIRGLIQLRNEMAFYLSRQTNRTQTDDGKISYHMGRLPDPINNQRACLKCAQLTNCCIYQKSIEQRTLNSSMSSLVPNTLGHLLQDHIDFYIHWCLLLDLETKASTDRGGISDLWCKTGADREQEGNCISCLKLSEHHGDPGADFTVVKFTRHPSKHIHRSASTSINTIGIAVHDYMIISTEKTNHLALCNGTVVSITEDDVDVAIESDSIQRLLNLRDEIFRLDKYNSFSTANILYTNVSKLMVDEPRSEKLRKLIIERKNPEFVGKLSKSEIEKVKEIFKPLNKPQKTSVLKVLMSKDYILIKGYPGTGKTATIVAIVRVLNLLGLSVLLTSYTHSAVDNILLKLIKHNIQFVRLGKTSKIHPQIQKYSADTLTKRIQSVGELREFYTKQKVIATSCLGINHPVFTQKRFDVCIVDEASQVLLPACLGPLFCAERFVLVGDPKQLPPVVQSKEARKLGMDESLFAMLDGSGATFELNLQYRMNRQIMALSNMLVYNGALQCGSDSVALGQLSVDTSDMEEPWLIQMFQDNPYKAAVFLDTSKISALESKDNSGMIVNIGESKIVQQITTACLKGGVLAEDIGVIAPYRHQVRLIHDRLSHQSIEVNTVDQYQGRDKDLIIISFTRSFRNAKDQENKSGELLKDVRRLNVAVSRAKKKLILVGNQVTLKSYQPVADILKMMTDNDLIISVMEMADVG